MEVQKSPAEYTVSALVTVLKAKLSLQSALNLVLVSPLLHWKICKGLGLGSYAES